MSPDAFRNWHDSATEVRDKVTRSQGRLTLRATTKADPVKEATYTVEESTWLPVAETVELRDGTNVEITALPNTPDSAAPTAGTALIGDADAQAAAAPAGSSEKAEASPGGSGSASKAIAVEDSEVFARVALHRIDAEEGQIEFRRQGDGTLLVKTLVESESRKQALTAALGAIPGVKPDIRTFDEAAGKSSVTVPRSGPNGVVTATAIPALQQELEALFPNAGDRETFVNSVLAESQRASADAWETGQLVRRYGDDDVRKLGTPGPARRWNS